MSTVIVLLALGVGGLAAGILVGRYYVPDDRALKRSARHARAYVRTINFLLERDRDAAVDELIQVVAENVDDVEPYFALGALFRARGEWERAIRVHQAIELRCQDDHALAWRARYQLGLDFRRAGMPRRATRAMEECLLEDGKHIGALKALCGLYEEQGRFADAAATWKRLDRLGAPGSREREHHLLCAAAQRAIERGDLDSAKRFLRDAQRIDGESVHLLVAFSELAAAKGQWDRARARLEQALQERPDLVRFLAGPLRAAEIECHSHLPTESERSQAVHDEMIATLTKEKSREPLVTLALAELRAERDPGEAIEEIRGLAATRPELLSARIAAARVALASGEQDDMVSALRDLVAAGGPLDWAMTDSWRCEHCGRSDEHFFWRCDSCRCWGGACVDSGPLPSANAVPRDRRAESRSSLAGRALASLPAPSLASGLSEEEHRDVDRRPPWWGRAGSWLGRAARAMRGRKASSPD